MANKATQQAESKRDMLKNYLGQYYRAKIKERQLEQRLKDLMVEKSNPMPGRGYSPVPHSTTNSVNDGPAAALMIRQEEIEERIKAQQGEIQKKLLNVMNIMDFLPLDSVERTILESRHIDCLSWKDVMQEVHMTRTPCNKHYNKALDTLLEYKRIQKLIEDYVRECGCGLYQENNTAKRGDRCKGRKSVWKKGQNKLHTDLIQENRSSWQEQWERHCTYAQE